MGDGVDSAGAGTGSAAARAVRDAASLQMIAFDGFQLPAEVAASLADKPVAGVTLFRPNNVASAAQLRELTAALQRAVPEEAAPLLVAADQEGGQLIALGDFTTQFAGAMAIGATADEQLAQDVARATGRELRALGVNVNYAPVCDLATNPGNPGLGIRSFGDDPAAAAPLVAATVRGLQEQGVAATLKHFPGKGDSAVDTHHQLAVVRRGEADFKSRELVPFKAGLEAGARLVMSGHFALPALTGDETLPCTLSRRAMTDLLRDELGFDGLATTDALDMKALAQGSAQAVDVICAVRAGNDLLLGTVEQGMRERVSAAVAQALLRGLIQREAVEASRRRLGALRRWLAAFGQPELDVVGSAEHRELAERLARRSITLVRDDASLLPLRLPGDARLAVVMPRPEDLTPADTSSYLRPDLAGAIRRRHARTDELLTDLAPGAEEIAGLRQRLADYDLIVLGTISAHLQVGQAELARTVLALDRPTVSLAMRTPWDLTTYPQATTHLCTYGILPPTIEALAGALFGEAPTAGRLPVELAGLYRRGHGLTSAAVA
ncbi:MAG TPA: glycoside hydrolase family 3 protein [Candidatus Limnocylindria bacterium]|nr:glycoside hydrolase family 3 protein [Candidatus Limnocylindria bacterium]